ncbi:GntR family transcriptional regulator [Alkaliphilus transvaalensis]|uniref:GntR family transcriptional regulator n=1 Tax=Alkaliphilus transvaalensis TaxID=114628 RepID=UPI00047D30B4|nr:GntR family transcriptional regulator [Alkaliphilus transvaalensis]
MTWDLESDRPIYAQLVDQIELKICSGTYPLGSKLPSVRDLAKEASVNPNTMQRALAKLEDDGLLYTNRTSGRYVTEDYNMVQQLKNKIAQEHIQFFLNKMTDLGFERNEILSILSTMVKKEDTKNE